MENLLTKFKCSSCNTQGQIELIHENAWTKSLVLPDIELDGLIFEEPEICNYGDAWYRCANCDQPIEKDGIRIGSSEDDLIEFLEEL